GELKVRPETEFPQERFRPGARLYWWRPPEPPAQEQGALEGQDVPATGRRRKKPPRTTPPQECLVESVRWHGNWLLVKLKGIETIEQAERLHGAWLMIPPEERMPLPEDEYYLDDLIGMTVYTESGERLGILKRVIPGAAYDFYEVGRHLIPAHKRFVLEVDVPRKRMVVRLPEE
ncbi:MAG: ribosome maturation factor RimM, partial [Fimbriimonadales bacterium]|nr:ribosome maturation factor RimM [Fimbriimonadales bacterium]